MTVVVVDDHPLFRHALTEAVLARGETDVIAEFGSSAEAIEAMPQLEPDVCVIDLSSPEIDPIDVLKEVCASSPTTRVLMLTSDCQSDRVWSMIEEGAAGVALKTAEADELADAVIAVARGEAVIPQRLHQGIAQQIRSRRLEARHQLSSRELEILRSVAEGNSAAEIAAHLSLAESTVKTHLTRVYDKLGVSERAAAVAEAMRRGLID